MTGFWTAAAWVGLEEAVAPVASPCGSVATLI